MNATNKLKLLILSKFDSKYGLQTTESEIEAAYEATDNDEYGDKDMCFQDCRSEVRGSGEESGLDATAYSRHFECDAHAIEALDGSWVGFNYWHGGGKHGEPEAMEWIETAYDVTSKEVLKPVRIFEKTQGAAS